MWLDQSVGWFQPAVRIVPRNLEHVHGNEDNRKGAMMSVAKNLNAWSAWLEDNVERFPADKTDFVRSVYFDAYADGVRETDHKAVTDKLEALDKVLATYSERVK